MANDMLSIDFQEDEGEDVLMGHAYYYAMIVIISHLQRIDDAQLRQNHFVELKIG